MTRADLLCTLDRIMTEKGEHEDIQALQAIYRIVKDAADFDVNCATGAYLRDFSEYEPPVTRLVQRETPQLSDDLDWEPPEKDWIDPLEEYFYSAF